MTPSQKKTGLKVGERLFFLIKENDLWLYSWMMGDDFFQYMDWYGNQYKVMSWFSSN